MRILLLFLFLLLMTPGEAWAGLSRAALQSVSVRPPAAARLDPALTAPDTNGTVRSIGTLLQGHPGFVTFVDYTCRTLCGTDLMLLADGIRRAGLRPGAFRIIVIGIDPRDNAQAALKMERDQIPPALRPVTTFLLPGQAVIAKATGSLGFHYVYDPGTDQFAHPAIVYPVAADGSLRGTLSPLALTAGDLRQVLETAQPQTLSLYQRIRSICYGYDPVTGLYTSRATLLLKAGALATLLLVAISLVFFSRLGRRRP
jgi:protein SCO1/2